LKKIDKSKALFEEAKDLMPGGVNSPVRAFKNIGGSPIFFKSGKGAYIYDEDGNEYIDFIGSWGPLIMGHTHPQDSSCNKESIRGRNKFWIPHKN